MINFLKNVIQKPTTENQKKVEITELVLRDAHQSLFATRMRIDDMLPIADKLDKIGYWSMESWGGATFDSCIRYLGEDPWDRIREIKAVMPNTPQQMLLRGQNLLGYRHYSDDVVRQFIERCAENGVSVFRIFDAMNDMRNLKTAVDQTVKLGQHAQGTISYTVSPVHTMQTWIDMAKAIEDMGAHSLCIKDMAGLLRPYDAYDLVKKLKATVDIPIQLHAHATTGLSTASIVKAVEAGIDRVDTAIGSMSMTYGHSATNSVVSILENSPRKTGLDLAKLEEIDAYFRPIRTKYAQFEGSLKGVDSRILLSQVPGGMLTNMESQLREQNALDKMDEVMAEIPRVRKDLGYIPLVTPTSQIVGTQSVLNVLTGDRYTTITKESAGILKGEYGATPAPVNQALQTKVLDGSEPITCRPADNIAPEMHILEQEFDKIVAEKGLTLADNKIDDLLTYALFPQVGISFIENRDNAEFFESAPKVGNSVNNSTEEGSYTVSFKGTSYKVDVSAGGNVTSMKSAVDVVAPVAPTEKQMIDKIPNANAEEIGAPLSGNIWKVMVLPHQKINEGDVLVILEAMKMETEIKAARSGIVASVSVKEGDAVTVGQTLLSMV
ncbi:Oxaloacetate decarboxylase Na(+) pump, alpha chain (EC 4.1.1.3) [uncultured Gammaproteobacteria bacterium]|jgi:oxaloacetate decarboxylase alpha subunit|uniref:Oxaloacetate decarboxylase Na(+) pump, alpha chain (EC) n=3 Tax=sulfur-oxidizing symbionts TaxID=32036 RepID=A0ACA8ZR44_9GAMM|nr:MULTISPECIES: sodium-extruding oxaloacetate decarboxylase subunit alpha [sulfur-oxidizing symbionts]CAC9433070.1 Oxaloacetate decarboxylase Na(+) pump, alpha chain (EC 4.1.1.3) [uncultured Gammaproteobacteria bacterium]CAB5501039.1 Oxaloacetate decarboxylase Na(+) pump, alpha chain (EC [Bathymodiolus azoricus thioautotrophic gill symbiont]CAB5505315.1 Oxaloacetate decarboxylase Na(+) pump, alpha chain (EC [Bathymodiolus thermophilus thioautotrophic gill symbiont]CAC9482806.1 Oxaloacetate dec